MNWVRWLGTVLIWISGVEATLFVVLYHVTSPWWRTRAGRSIMGLLGVIAAVLDLSIARQVAGDAPWFVWLRLAVFAGLPLEIGRRTLLLIRLQVRNRRAQKEQDAQG